jgi:plasmid stabilization system protein ParE
MPRGAYTAKQDRKAQHIEEGYEKRGVSKKEAESRAWATVNKQDKGGKNDGSGRSRSRSAAAKKGWETRRRRGHRERDLMLDRGLRSVGRHQFRAASCGQ